LFKLPFQRSLPQRRERPAGYSDGIGLLDLDLGLLPSLAQLIPAEKDFGKEPALRRLFDLIDETGGVDLLPFLHRMEQARGEGPRLRVRETVDADLFEYYLDDSRSPVEHRMDEIPFRSRYSLWRAERRSRGRGILTGGALGGNTFLELSAIGADQFFEF